MMRGIRSIVMQGAGAALLLSCVAALAGCGRSQPAWSLEPMPYDSSEQGFVDAALDIYIAGSYYSNTRAEAMNQVYPVTVDLPDAVCVGLHVRPKTPAEIGQEMTICFDKSTGEVLTKYYPDVRAEFQHIPDKFKRPRYGEVDDFAGNTEAAKP